MEDGEYMESEEWEISLRQETRLWGWGVEKPRVGSFRPFRAWVDTRRRNHVMFTQFLKSLTLNWKSSIVLTEDMQLGKCGWDGAHPDPFRAGVFLDNTVVRFLGRVMESFEALWP